MLYTLSSVCATLHVLQAQSLVMVDSGALTPPHQCLDISMLRAVLGHVSDITSHQAEEDARECNQVPQVHHSLL